MRTKTILLISILFLMMIAERGELFAYQKLSGSVSLSSQGTIPFTPQAVLDDFATNSSTNKWGGPTGTFNANGGTCAASYTSAPGIVYGGSDNSLQLVYNVSPAGSYAGYSSKLGSQSLVGYTAISFMVRGAVGGEFFKVELKNTTSNLNTNHAAVYITDYLDGGVTTGWQAVTIPLDNFANISDWSSGSEFCITFEGDQSGLVGSPKQGAIYIDNITFGNSAVNVVRINSFGTKLGRCALGGNMGSMPNAYPTIPWANFLFQADGTILSQYNVDQIPWWSGHFMIFGGGNDGSVAVPHDFSNFNYLKFNIAASNPAKNPKTLKIELADGAGNKDVYINNITTSWQTFVIPLSSFSGLSKTSIKQLNFVYDATSIYYAGGLWQSQGEISIDDVRFDKNS